MICPLTDCSIIRLSELLQEVAPGEVLDLDVEEVCDREMRSIRPHCTALLTSFCFVHISVLTRTRR